MNKLPLAKRVLREYMSATIRPQSWLRALTLAEATADTEAFTRRFAVLDDGPAVWDELMRLIRACLFGGKQAHDANFVATMPASGERRLLTFSAADFRRFDGLIGVVAP